MTEQEAFAEARRRWGEEAGIRCLQSTDSGWKGYLVGRELGEELEILGEGASWEEAFRTPTKKQDERSSRVDTKANHSVTRTLRWGGDGCPFQSTLTGPAMASVSLIIERAKLWRHRSR
jgi:hypothetical protein